MKKTYLLLSILLLNVTLSIAQEKVFIVNRNFNKVIDRVSQFQSALVSDGGFDAAKSDKIFSTNILIKNETYSRGTRNNYLVLKYKTQSMKALISTNWAIKLTKVTAVKTKITVSLVNIESDQSSRLKIDISKSVSSGKLEKQLKDYILSTKTTITTEQAVPGETSSDSDSTQTSEAMQTSKPIQISQKTENYEQTPVDTIVVAKKAATNTEVIKFKNSANLAKLLDQTKLIPLPTTAGYFTERLGFEPKIADNELCENGYYYIWDFTSGVNLIYSRLKDKSQYCSIAYFGKDKVSGLPLGLTFNESTFEACKSQFDKFKPAIYQETAEVSDSEAKAFLVMDFKTGKYFVKLGFYNNNYLTSVQISTAK